MRYVDACEQCNWTLRFWPKDDPASFIFCPFNCRSWRHKGECQRWKGAQDFVRCKEAIQAHRDWVYIVLTYGRSGFVRPRDLFRWGVDHWARLRKRFTRAYGTIRYIQTWEVHKDGYPHLNLLIGNPKLFDIVRKGWYAWRLNWLEPAAVACGFGMRTWVKKARLGDALAGYLTKLSRELTGAGSKDQVPYDAPPHFRRLRASQGLLPPVHKNPDITGLLLHMNPALAAHFFPPPIPPDCNQNDGAILD